MQLVGPEDTYVSMLFVLAVFLISRFTEGYVCGTVAALLSVLAVNYVFTYPYLEFNFTPTGYPLTMLCMLAVAMITGAMTTQIKRQETMRSEIEKEKMRSTLLRAISHDLRTPLTSILGASSAIIENDALISGEERLKLLGEVKEEAQWLIRMVENLLTVTRMDAMPQSELHKEKEAVEELVADTLQKFEKRFPDAKVTLRVPDELLMIPMDAMLIEQVLINLLENVVFHAKGATETMLTVRREEKNAVFEVSDNGCGMDMERRQALPKRPADGDQRRSMGIGLSVCNAIVAAHNGDMKAFNNASGGATVQFTLPLEEQS